MTLKKSQLHNESVLHHKQPNVWVGLSNTDNRMSVGVGVFQKVSFNCRKSFKLQNSAARKEINAGDRKVFDSAEITFS